MATGNMTITTHDAFIPEIWSREVLYQTVNASIFAGLVRRDFDGEINNEGDVVHVPLISAVTIGTKQPNTAVVFTNYTESTKDITVNQHKYFAFRVEDIARVQSKPELITPYATQGGRGLAKDIDTALATMANDAAVTQNVGTLNTAGTAYTNISDVIIRNAIQLLDEANAPEQDRYLIISPAQKNAMLGIEKFVSADKLGSDQSIRKGVFGEIYGVMVFVSNNLADTVAQTSLSAGHPLIVARKSCIMFQKEAYSLVTQREARVQSAYSLEHLATEVVGDVLYGHGDLQPTFIVDVRVVAE